MNNKLYVQYGCGLSAPKEWTNFDASPTLRLQKTPVLGTLIKSQLSVVFPDNVRYGNVVKGLPIRDNSCDGVYCSHVLEHLSLNDFRLALKNTYKVLKPGAIFRCIVPDLEVLARAYVDKLNEGGEQASIKFVHDTLLGLQQRPTGMKGIVTAVLGNSHHLWMWDHKSMISELEKAGFKNIRKCEFNDSEDEMFKLVESKERFENAVSLECRK